LKEEWDYIFFTGSTRVGKLVYESAAANLTPVTLELGGKSPCIVDETASIGVAAKRIVWGKFLNAGQTCIAPDYILVQEQVKDALIEALKKNIESFYGDTRNPSKDLARIVSTGHYKRLIHLLEGQKIIFGGHTQEDENYLSPTLLLQSDPNSPVMQEEIFGPILPIIVFKEEDEITPWLLSQGKPLAAYVFSKRKSFQERFIKKYRFGGGVINDTLIHITNKNLPFGGVGQSGIGAYHGKRTFDLFSHHKSIVKRGTWIDIPLRNPPYTLPLKFMKKMKHLL
jgi:aldehyde dehydrogenase (NAD+)